MRHPTSNFVQLGRLRPSGSSSSAKRFLRDPNRRPAAHEALEHFTQSAGPSLVSGSLAQLHEPFRAPGRSPFASAALRSSEASLFSTDAPASDAVPLPPVPVKLRDNPFVQQFAGEKHAVDDWDLDINTDKRALSASPAPNAKSEAPARHRVRRSYPPNKIGSSPRTSFQRLHKPPTSLRFGIDRSLRDASSASDQKTQASSHASGSGAESSRQLTFANGAIVEAHRSMIVFQDPETRAKSAISFPRLREMCQCEKCVDPSTRQRNFTLGQVMSDVKTSGWLDTAPISSQLHSRGDHLVIKWPSHTSHVNCRQLQRSARPASQITYDLTKTWKRKFWVKPDMLSNMVKQSDDLPSSLPRSLRVPFETVFPRPGQVDQAAHTSLLNRLHRFGIAILHDVPSLQTGDRDCTLRTVAESIGPIRHTFYGETWNVKSMPESKNVAYTDVNLGLHMDLLYFTEPPRFQILHCLRNRVAGGDSYFVDAFGAALQFANAHPQEAKLLCEQHLLYQYRNDGHNMENTHPIFPPSLDVQALRSVMSWSPPFQGMRTYPTLSGNLSTSQDFATKDIELFSAIEKWENFVEDPARRYEFVMKEGDLVLFDNRRVLHARKAFRDMTVDERSERGVEIVDGEPTRWLKGCYLDGDVVWDKLATARRSTAQLRSRKAEVSSEH